MTKHDNDRNMGSNHIMERLDRYFFDTPIQCPYGLDNTAVYRQALFGILSDQVFGVFLKAGYRRNGNCIYTMSCPECSACIPFRINPVEFRPNRNQKRVLRKNEDVDMKIGPLEISTEKIDLCNVYLQTRYPGKDNSAEEYYSFFFLNAGNFTFEVSYRIGNRLIGVGIVDLSPHWLSAVYFYFDPAEGKRSPGTFNVLSLIKFCKEHKIDFLYLGYWIKQVREMSYKANFRPHHLLLNGIWTPGKKSSDPLGLRREAETC